MQNFLLPTKWLFRFLLKPKHFFEIKGFGVLDVLPHSTLLTQKLRVIYLEVDVIDFAIAGTDEVPADVGRLGDRRLGAVGRLGGGGNQQLRHRHQPPPARRAPNSPSEIHGSAVLHRCSDVNATKNLLG